MTTFMFRKTVFLKNALLDNLCGVHVLLHARSPFFIFIMEFRALSTCRRKKSVRLMWDCHTGLCWSRIDGRATLFVVV